MLNIILAITEEAYFASRETVRAFHAKLRDTVYGDGEKEKDQGGWGGSTWHDTHDETDLDPSRTKLESVAQAKIRMDKADRVFEDLLNLIIERSYSDE